MSPTIPQRTDIGVTSASKRIVTGLVGAPLVVAAVWFGGWPFFALVGLAALIAQYELYDFAEITNEPVTLFAGLATGAVVLLRVQLGHNAEFALLAGVLAILASSLLLHRGGRALMQCGVALAGVLYPTLLLSYAVVLRFSDTLPGVARELTLLTVVGVWSADTIAYFYGKRFGRHHMSRISPKKTWEGYVAGVVGGLLAVAVLSEVIGPLGAKQTLFIGCVCGLLGPVGDLIESALKRSAQVKDSGTILPGHGGLLDRLDALIFVSPIVYVWAMLQGLL